MPRSNAPRRSSTIYISSPRQGKLASLLLGRRPPARGRLLRWFAAAAVFSIALLGVFAVGGALTYQGYARQFVPPTDAGVNQPARGAEIYDRNGHLLYRYIDEEEGLRAPVPLDSISPHLLAATIATEDNSFYDNPGLNPQGLLRAAWENVNPLSGDFLDGSGGSSITQQLVKNVYFESDERASRSLNRKLKEAVFAIEMTGQYDKDQILEWYLNQISYGGVHNGIESASWGYFGKSSSDLTLAEAALLAGLPQAPAMHTPRHNLDAAIARRNEILELMLRQERIKIGPEEYYDVSAEEIEAAKQEEVHIVQPHFPLEAPHFVFSYIEPQLEAMFGREALLNGGLKVVTTLEIGLQNRAAAILEESISPHEERTGSRNGSMVIVEPRTGEVIVMVGSRDYFRDDIDGRNNNALALNSPGSALKPFVYLGAFMKLDWAPASMIEDEPVRHTNPDGSIFEPVNPGGGFRGQVTVREALGNSLNIPAYHAAQQTGIHDIVNLLRHFGITTLDGSYGPALATGGVDVTQLDLAFAYTVLANNGVIRGIGSAAEGGADEDSIHPVSILKVTDARDNVLFDADEHRTERRLVPAGEVFLVNHIISDPNATCDVFGCGRLGVPGLRPAVKTGTSEPFDPEGPNAGMIADTWAFGYTPDVVVSAWAGNADNAPIDNIFSTTIAFPAMRDLMLAYFEDRTPSAFPIPDDVVRARVCTEVVFGAFCARAVEDYFLQRHLSGLRLDVGRRQDERQTRPEQQGPRIVIPDEPRAPQRGNEGGGANSGSGSASGGGNNSDPGNSGNPGRGGHNRGDGWVPPGRR